MTLSEILSNEELRQHEFPVAKNKIFLGHAGVCALPRRVAQARIDCANGGTLGDQEAFVMHKIAAARKALTRLAVAAAAEFGAAGTRRAAAAFAAAEAATTAGIAARSAAFAGLAAKAAFRFDAFVAGEFLEAVGFGFSLRPGGLKQILEIEIGNSAHV